MSTAFGTQGSQVRILPLRPEIVGFFVLISVLGQVGHRFGHRNLPTLLADGGCSPMQVVGMVVAMGVLKDLRRHPQEPSRLQIGTPRCISQVAAVWRKVCGVTRPGRRASPQSF